jgi:transketolase
MGKAEVITEGNDVTILTYSLLFEQALIAVEILKSEGLSVGLVNMRSLKPVDEQAILKVSAQSKLVVTLEDHFLTGGLYSIVAEVLLKYQTTANVLPIALNEKWFRPAFLPDVLQHEGFTGKQIAERILGYKTTHHQPQILTPEFSE